MSKATFITMPAVAYVHDGAPPQTNVVHVDGQNAVLLSIVKSGATSTLAIISQIKQLLPSIRATLPSSLNIAAVGDQSPFVPHSVSGAIQEGGFAAALTALWTLCFTASC